MGNRSKRNQIRRYFCLVPCVDSYPETTPTRRMISMLPQINAFTVNPYQRDIEMKLVWASRKCRRQIIKGRRHLGLFNQIYQLANTNFADNKVTVEVSYQTNR